MPAGSRLLRGTTEEMLLCTFSARPDAVRVVLRAAPWEFRLVGKKARYGRNADEVDRVVGALARLATLGKPDVDGSHVLDAKTAVP